VGAQRLDRVRIERAEGARGRLGLVLNMDRLSKRRRLQLADASAEEDGPDDGRRRLPITRGECVNGPRPCPHVGCRHHLYLDVQHGGNIRIAFRDREPDEMEYSCSLDVADGGVRILDEMATVLGVTRERTRQIFERALVKMRAALERQGITAEDMLDMLSGGRLLPFACGLGGGLALFVLVAPVAQALRRGARALADGGRRSLQARGVVLEHFRRPIGVGHVRKREALPKHAGLQSHERARFELADALAREAEEDA
jgi:hypothetical protein